MIKTEIPGVDDKHRVQFSPCVCYIFDITNYKHCTRTRVQCYQRSIEQPKLWGGVQVQVIVGFTFSSLKSLHHHSTNFASELASTLLRAVQGYKNHEKTSTLTCSSAQ